jgi:crotonobetainyl-CoA:carnitine CoA-transferase CaiB-like acyl-CoA transferase
MCTMILGDLGAEVLKIETPQGDLGRSLGPPFIKGESVSYLCLNRNKKGMAIDLKNPLGVNIVRKMASSCDVLVENFRPGVLARLGLGYEELSRINDRLIYCSVSAYGQTGPWKDKPGLDGIVQGTSGLMSVVGLPDTDPCKIQTPAVDMVTGMLAALSVLSALLARNNTGRGQEIDVSMYNAAIMLQQMSFSFYLNSGELPRKMGSAAPYATPNEAVPTKDGHIMLAAYHPQRWLKLCRLLEREDLIKDKRFSTNEARLKNRRELMKILGQSFREKTTGEWLEILEQNDIISGPVETYDNVAASPQALHDQSFISINHPFYGEIKMPGFGLKFSETPARVKSPPPSFGENTEDILLSFGFDKSEIDTLYKSKVIF